jgi:hypothetical protein
MDRTSVAAHWPWRKWLLAGTAMAGSVTVVGGPVAVGSYGCNGDSCASVAPCAAPDACPAQLDVAQEDTRAVDSCAADDACPDGPAEDAPEDVAADRAADAPSTTDGGVDGGDTGGADGPEDAAVEAE